MPAIDYSTVSVLDVTLEAGGTFIVGLDGDSEAHMVLPTTFPTSEGAALVAEKIRVEIPEDPWGTVDVAVGIVDPMRITLRNTGAEQIYLSRVIVRREG